MVQKIIAFNVALKSTERQWVQKIPEVYTNDLGSVSIKFNITDCTDTELTGSSAIVLLKMRDGSFFQGPSVDVERTLNVFSYTLKENEGNHDGLAEIQLIVTISGKEFATQKYQFKVNSGLDSEVAREIMIYDWTTLTAEARAYIDQFTADEMVRDAEFDNAQFDRNTAFVASQDARTLAFGTEQTNRGTAFTAEQNERTTIFNESESGRLTAETVRVTAEEGRVEAETDRVTEEGKRVTAESGRVTAESGRVTAETNRAAAFIAFDTRLQAEETATAANKVSAVKSKTFADVDSRIEDVEFDTTLMATNLIRNGDFSNGSTGWGAVTAVVDGRGSKLATSQWAGMSQTLSTVVGNIYYVSAEIEGTAYNYLEVVPIGAKYVSSNNKARVSIIGKAKWATDTILVGDSRSSGWTTYYVDNVVTIDLTATFGAGNEPTVEQMDAIMAKFPNSWFDGTKNLFQAKASLNKLMALDARTEFEAKNLVGNGSFEGLISPWLTYGTSTSGLSVRDISTSKKVSGISSVYVKRALGESAGYGYQQKVNIILGNKVYLRAAAYIPSSSLSPVTPTVSMEGVPYGSVKFLTDVKDAWQYKSAIFTPTATGAVSCILQVVSDVTYDGECYFDDITVIDLTATFGAGKEPTLAEMDRLMARFPNSWFDGVKPIQTIETLYQEKANKVQEAWITPTLLNGVTHFSNPLRYRKNEFGVVEFKGGVVLPAGFAAYTNMFSMPIGYRPPNSTRFSLPLGTSTVVLDMQEIATQTLVSATGNLIFDGVSYAAI